MTGKGYRGVRSEGAAGVIDESAAEGVNPLSRLDPQKGILMHIYPQHDLPAPPDQAQHCNGKAEGLPGNASLRTTANPSLP